MKNFHTRPNRSFLMLFIGLSAVFKLSAQCQGFQVVFEEPALCSFCLGATICLLQFFLAERLPVIFVHQQDARGRQKLSLP